MQTGGATGEAWASEIKFIVDADLGARAREWARRHLQPDPHGSGPTDDLYRITSLYLDTAARDVFHRRGSFGRSKYRIRRYEDDHLFVERKLRMGSRLAKRRTAVTIDALPQLTNGIPTADPAYWFARRLRLRRLEPVCQVIYARTARVAEVNGGLIRLTVDDDLYATPVAGLAFQAESGVRLLTGQVILELKYRGYMPGLFRQLVEEFRLVQGAASKYRMAADALGLVPASAAGEAPSGHHA
jgi:hypothetical protein